MSKMPDLKEAAEWISPELTGDPGTVTALVPNRYESYLRVFHPVRMEDELTTLQWQDVATARGIQMRPEVQWHEIIGSEDPANLQEAVWTGGRPLRGGLPSELYERVLPVLRVHTDPSERCVFGLWCGQFEEDPEGPHVSLPPLAGRDYLLLAQTLRDAMPAIPAGLLSDALVNFIWPLDKAWYVAADMDLDSTLVGGSAALCREILSLQDVEAMAIDADESLAVT